MKETKGLLKKQEKVRAGAYLAIIVLLCAASWLSICGCDRQSEPIGDGNQSKTDFQNSWYAQGSHRIFTESEEHYYFIAYTGGQAFLYFADKEAMEPHPLCKREGCLHEEEPDFDKRKQCDAFIDEGAQYACINFADGYLYLLSALGNSSCLVRIDEKTGERTALYWLDRTTGSNAAVHRGYLYTAVTTKSNVNYNISQIWRHSLEKKESELLCEIPTAASSSNELKAFKESLYIRGINLDELNQTVYYRLDLDTGEQEMLKPFDGETGVDLAFCQDSILFGAVPIDDRERWNESSMDLYVIGSANGEESGNAGRSGSTVYQPFTADQNYFYQWNTLLGERSLSGRELTIYDAQGKQVDSLSIEALDILSVYVGPGENVFLTDIGFGEANTYYYFPKSEIGSGRITPRLFFKGIS